MTCIERAPVSIDEWLELVNRCAVAAGGEDWTAAALTGAAAVLVIAVLLVALVAVVRTAAR